MVEDTGKFCSYLDAFRSLPIEEKEIMGKKKKSNEVIFEEIINDIQRATIKGKVIHGKRTARLKIKKRRRND